MAAHSLIVGGSSARRLINCPGSRQLVDKVPKRPPGKFADKGTLLHEVLEQMLRLDIPAEALLGKRVGEAVLTEELIDEKIVPALQLLDQVDPDKTMEYVVETTVSFGEAIVGVFGSADLVGRRDKTAIFLDWKMGDGVMVEAVDNEQGLFYVAAGMHTPELKWVFDGAEDVEIIIIQPPNIRRWKTSFARVLEFEQELIKAVKLSGRPDAPLNAGDWCKFCNAKSICPVLTGEVDRALRSQVKALDGKALAEALDKADILKMWLDDVYALSQLSLEEGGKLPGYKLVNKRATRKWSDEKVAVGTLLGVGLKIADLTDTKMKSPAQIETLLKKHELGPLPKEIVAAVSSGVTIARDDDPRPAALTIGNSLKSALSRIQ